MSTLMGSMLQKLPLKFGVQQEQVQNTIQAYEEEFDDPNKSTADRKTNYESMVNMYYDLVTDLYEYGWGQSFHFAPRHQTESFKESVIRHELWLAHMLGIQPGMKVLDVGCGVGGPLRNIARFTKAHITGLNNNGYQVQRANLLNGRANLSQYSRVVKGNFMNIEFPKESFDVVYQIEATAHAPDKVECYKQIFKVLKEGGVFGGYEWCMTDEYDPENARHRSIKHEIARGDGLPDISTTHEVIQALKDAGFEVEMYEDVVVDSEIPWYHPLQDSYSLAGFQRSWFGRNVSRFGLKLLEALRIAPKGSAEVSMMLEGAAQSLVAGGREGIFTPSFFYVARKPVTNKKKNK